MRSFIFNISYFHFPVFICLHFMIAITLSFVHWSICSEYGCSTSGHVVANGGWIGECKRVLDWFFWFVWIRAHVKHNISWFWHAIQFKNNYHGKTQDKGKLYIFIVCQEDWCFTLKYMYLIFSWWVILLNFMHFW